MTENNFKVGEMVWGYKRGTLGIIERFFKNGPYTMAVVVSGLKSGLRNEHVYNVCRLEKYIESPADF